MFVRLFTLVCFALSVISPDVFAQDDEKEKDSLKLVIRQLPEDRQKVKAMLRLADILLGEADSAGISLARQAIKLSRELSYHAGIGTAYDYLGRFANTNHRYDEAIQLYDSAVRYFKIEDDASNIGMLLNQMGIMKMQLNEYEAARSYYEESLEAYTLAGDSIRMANEYLNIGITYEIQGFHSVALEYYFKCLKIDEQVGNEAGIPSDYMSIALILKRQNDFPSAIKYYKQALELSQKLDDKFTTGSIYTNLGVIYKDEGNYDLALETQHKALEIFEEMDNRRGLLAARHNMAVVYYKMGDLEKAMHHLEIAMELEKPLNNDYVEQVNYILLARIYSDRGRHDDAIGVLQNVIRKTAEIGLLTEQNEAVDLLGEVYEANHQPALALEMMHRSGQLKDSIFNLEKSKQIQELQTIYETTQKEKEIELLSKERALQESEIKRKSLQQNMTLATVGLLFLIGFVSFRSYTLRQKQKRLLLDQQLKNEKLEAERLQELDEAKSRFFANIAHEFRTPLTLILGPAEQIIENNHDPRSSENAQLIRQNADKLLSLTNQLLDLSKLESGMIRLYPVRNDFVAFAKGCAYAFESLAEEKDIEIVFHSDSESILMDFDPEKASIIINNLVSNAIKFTGPFGKVHVTIRDLSGEGPEPALEIKVSDTGIGIPEKQLPLIFERFYQVDDSMTRKTQGTGIGLALAKELVELHRGSISVSSVAGKGTTFTIYMPINHELAETTDLKEKTLPANGNTWAEVAEDNNDLSESALGNRKERDSQTILVVEDNPEVRRFIINILRNYYRTIEAANGVEGLAKTIEEIPDLIISDVMMPEMDGYEFCRSVKEDDRTSHIPVIMLTAKAGLESKMEGLETGVDDYLAKPFNARELLARIKNLIRIRKQLHEKFNATQDPGLFAKKENAFITKLKEVIDENIDKEEFNVVDLGKALAMSRTQVHRKLKALTNLSTSQFIRRYKLEKAVGLLKSGDHNVSEVAYMLGFSTPNYFSTCFAEQYGYPPSEVARAQS